ncbi:MAG: hypothetical protein N3G78_11930 [Desulfobacterota bacterium]|nr:hypothetical protein [Thermodesulfobacteriota bacterium]
MRWKEVGVIDHRFEGDRLVQALKDAAIPHVLRSCLDTAYDGLYVPQKGWARVLVPEAWSEEAEKVVVEVKRSFQKEGDDETG